MTARGVSTLALLLGLPFMASSLPSAAQEAEAPPNCAIAAVGVLCELLGVGTGYDEVLALAGDLTERETVSVRHLVDLGKTAGLELTPMRASTTDLVDIGVPVIVHLKSDLGHFAVLEYLAEGGGVLIETGDPTPRVAVASLEDFDRGFSYVALVPAERPDPAGPRLRLPRVPFEDKVSVGWPREVTLTVANDGGAPFTFEITGVNCQCLTPTVQRATVPSNGAVDVGVTLTASGLRTEPTSLILACASDIPNRPVFHLALRGKAEVSGQIQRLRAARVRAGSAARDHVAVQLNHLAEPVEVSADVNWVRASSDIEQIPPQNRTAGRVNLEVSPEAPIGRHEVTIAAAFRSEFCPALSETFVFLVYGPVECSPSVLAVDPGVTRESVLRWDPEEVVSDLTVSTENLDGCEVMYERTGDGEGKVMIVPPAEAPQEVTTGWVRLTGTLASGLERVVGEVKVHLLPVDPFAVM